MLIVDDSQLDTELIRHDLFKNGKIRNDYIVAHTVKEAREYVLSNKVDLVFLDLNMDGEEPLDLLDFIKRDPVLKHIFVIVATASSDPRDWNRAHEKGADCYIVKPLNMLKLQEAVAGVPQLGWLVTTTEPLEVAA